MSRDTLLAHIVGSFVPRQWENTASESLRFLLVREGGRRAVNDLIRPFGLTLERESWRGQVGSSDDRGIPDLAALVDGRLPLIIEVKFDAALTEKQPVVYLARQATQFASPQEYLLVFLAPRRRIIGLVADLERRLGGRHSFVGSIPVIESAIEGAPGRVAIVSWGEFLGRLQAEFEAVADADGLADLAQLEGLCDRAERETMMPLSDEDIDPIRGLRMKQLRAVTYEVADVLAATGVVVRERGDVSNLNGMGPRLSTREGRQFLLWISYDRWGNLWPTPWWLEFSGDVDAVSHALEGLQGDPDFPHFDVQTTAQGAWLDVALRPPLGVDRETIVAELASMVARVCELLADAPVRELAWDSEPSGPEDGESTDTT